jgi:hypothetical protein
MQIDKKLQIVKMFQDKYPDTHLGGSLGLYLHGIDLKRDLKYSDIDLTTPDNIDKNQLLIINEVQESSNPSDFDYSLRYHPIDSSVYVKIEIRISPEPGFIVIEKDGINYNVSKLKDIIFWKTKYANNGSQKHEHDLIVINGGERPAIETPIFSSNDDLPF